MPARYVSLPTALERLNAEPTVSVEDAGRVLGVARSTAYAAVAAGEWPVIRVGRRVRVPTAWLRKQLQIETVGAA